MRFRFGLSSFKVLTSLVILFAVTSMTFADNGFVPLFNGKDIDGWVKRGGDATYKVEDGCIVGQRGEGPNTFLCPPKEYGNFVLYFECKFDEAINSGVQFRGFVSRKNGDREVVSGYQCELDDNSGHSGRIYDESRRNRWISNIGQDVTAPAFKKGEWNKVVIQAIGPCIKVWVNDVICSDFYDPADLKGFFGFQVHGSSEPTGKVLWRNIMVKELPASEWKSLLKNKEFDGLWVSPAGKWEMDDDGVVKATSSGDESRDGMLRYDEILKDYAARLTFKQGKGNSGLYFRAVEVDKPYWMRGFQDEIDGQATGSLWEVEGRGWVARNFETAAKVFKEGDWNTVSIVAVGDRLVTELNGQVIIDMIDPECLKEGKTAIQLHGGSDMEYYYKDFEVLPLTEEQVAMIQSETPMEPDFSEAAADSSASQSRRILQRQPLRDRIRNIRGR